MEIEIKPVYEDFYNKIIENSNKSNKSNKSNNSSSSASDLSKSVISHNSTNNKLLKSVESDKSNGSKKILKSKKQIKKLEKSKKTSSSDSNVLKKLNKIIETNEPKNINFNKKNKQEIKLEKKEFKNSKQLVNNKNNIESENYTNSSGLGEDNALLKSMYIQNIQKQQIENPKNTPNFNKFNYNSDSSLEKDKLLLGANKNKVKNKKLEPVSLLNTKSDSNSEPKKNIIYEPNKEDSSVASEFKQFFSKDRKAKLDDGKPKDINQKQLDKLEKIYDKAIEKKEKNKDKIKQKNKDINKNEEIIDEKKYKKKDLVKLMLNSIEKKIFLESTRGYNLENDIYKLDMQKLKTNLFNFKVDKDSKCTIGYLYRNFLNPKIYNTINNETNFWIETTKISNSTNLLETELEPKNKFLLACLKNFKKTKKFKKQIGSSLFRAHIKTVELLNTPNKLIIDIIFFVKYKVE